MKQELLALRLDFMLSMGTRGSSWLLTDSNEHIWAELLNLLCGVANEVVNVIVRHMLVLRGGHFDVYLRRTQRRNTERKREIYKREEVDGDSKICGWLGGGRALLLRSTIESLSHLPSI